MLGRSAEVPPAARIKFAGSESQNFVVNSFFKRIHNDKCTDDDEDSDSNDSSSKDEIAEYGKYDMYMSSVDSCEWVELKK